MDGLLSLSHSKWVCKYHAIWGPKHRKKKLFEELSIQLDDVFHELAQQNECEILEGHLLTDHVHILISIPPKVAVSSVVGFIKGKSAIYFARNFLEKRRIFMGESFWARGYYVLTVGLMKIQYVSTSSTRKNKINESTSTVVMR